MGKKISLLVITMILLVTLFACEKKNGWYGDYYFENNRMIKNEWRQYGNDWYYCGPKGKILKSAWVNNQYYVDATGKMLVNTITPDGYQVGADGKYVDYSARAKELLRMYENMYENEFKYRAIKNADGSYNMITQNYGIKMVTPEKPMKFDAQGNLWTWEERSSAMQSGGSETTTVVVYYITGGNSINYEKTETWDGDITGGNRYRPYEQQKPRYNNSESKKYIDTYKSLNDEYLMIKNKYSK